MTGDSWWAAELEKRLSQGDLLEDNVFSLAANPITALAKSSIGGKAGYLVSDWKDDANGQCSILANGRRGFALVLTHSCELDKPHARGRVIVCPVQPLSKLPLAQREECLAQKTFSRMPLPNVLNKEHYYADLNISLAADRRVVDASKRVASMTKVARLRLKTQLVAFYTRLDASGYTDRMPDEDVPGA